MTIDLGKLRRLTLAMVTARIMPAMMTKIAPLKRPIKITLLRMVILTFHSSYCG